MNSEQEPQRPTDPQSDQDGCDAESARKISPAGEQTEKESGKTLSSEEQMALYEEALKNEDWGHQPC